MQEQEAKRTIESFTKIVYTGMDWNQKGRAKTNPASAQQNNSATIPQKVIPAISHITKKGNTYYVPVRINDTITLPFILDTGATNLVTPVDVALTLMRAGALKRSDFIGQRSYRIANGSEEVSDVVVLRDVRVGDHKVRNVSAYITPAQSEPLLGQSSYRNSVPSPSITNGSFSSSLPECQQVEHKKLCRLAPRFGSRRCIHPQRRQRLTNRFRA